MADPSLTKSVAPVAESLSCTICFEMLNDPYTAIGRNDDAQCGHTFCKNCIDDWRSKQNTCPKCRAEIAYTLPNYALRATLVELRPYIASRAYSQAEIDDRLNELRIREEELLRQLAARDENQRQIEQERRQYVQQLAEITHERDAARNLISDLQHSIELERQLRNDIDELLQREKRTLEEMQHRKDTADADVEEMRQRVLLTENKLKSIASALHQKEKDIGIMHSNLTSLQELVNRSTETHPRSPLPSSSNLQKNQNNNHHYNHNHPSKSNNSNNNNNNNNNQTNAPSSSDPGSPMSNSNMSWSLFNRLWSSPSSTTNLSNDGLSFYHLSAFDFRGHLGALHNSRVIQAIRREDHQSFVFKRIDFSHCNAMLQENASYVSSPSKFISSVDSTRASNEKVRTFREAMFLYKLRHPHLVHLEGIARGPKYGEAYMVLPYYLHDLEYTVDCDSLGGKSFSPRAVQNVMRAILSAMQYMHSMNVAHRRLEPRAIVFNSVEHDIRITSLSHACSCASNPARFEWGDISLPVNYLSPEALLSLSTLQSNIQWIPVDMWAIGCIFGYMLRGRPLFKSMKPITVLKEILDIHECRPSNPSLERDLWTRCPQLLPILNKPATYSLRSFFPETIDVQHPHAIDLLEQLLNSSAVLRTLTSGALAHPYFSGATNPPPLGDNTLGISDFFDREVVPFVESNLRCIL